MGRSKRKDNLIRTQLWRNSCGCKSSSPCESPRLNNNSEKKWRTSQYLYIHYFKFQSDNECQFTKLAKQISRVKDIQIDSVIQAHPDERMHLTNTEVTSSNINEMGREMKSKNWPPDKEIDKPPSQNPTSPQNLKYQCSLLGIALSRNWVDIFLQVFWSISI